MLQLQNQVYFNNEQFEDILIYFSKSFYCKDNEEDILWDLAKNCIAKLGFVDCVVYLIDYDYKFLIQKSAYVPKSPKDYKLHNPVEIALGIGITGSVALSGKSEIIKDTSKDNRYIVDDKKRLSEICVPIIYESTIYGVIDCEHPEKNFFTKQHLKMLNAIASICAIKINSVRANKKLIEKQNKLFLLKEEMIELKLKALSSQLNPHFVFNALNAVQYFITSENKKSALDYLSVFSKLIRFYLNHLEKDTVFLKDEINMLNWYFKLQKLRYDNQFTYRLSIDKSLKNTTAIIPSSVIQTLFENIIEHAIFNQHKNEKLNVHFKISKGNIILNIEYRHDIIGKTNIYKPEYRARIIQWQDQIRLLNIAKNYGIEKKVTFIKNKNIQGGNITLKLPNLA